MQIVAEMWLVLRLTNSSFAVGLTAALQFVPMLFAGAWGGLLADRVPKRKLLMITQALMAIPALTLWALASTGNARTGWCWRSCSSAARSTRSTIPPARRS